MGLIIEKLQFVSGVQLTVFSGELLLCGWRNLGMIFPRALLPSTIPKCEINDRSTNHFPASYSRGSKRKIKSVKFCLQQLLSKL